MSQSTGTLSSRRRNQARPVLVYALLCLGAAVFLKDFFFLLLLSTLMLPYPVTMVLLFALFNALGWAEGIV